MRKGFCWMAAGLASLAFMAGCSRGPALEHWFVDSLVKVFPDDTPEQNRLRTPSFPAARNSNLSIQLALRSRRTLGDLYVDALPLTGPGMPIESIRVRWVCYVVVTSNTHDTPEEELVRQAPALFPDALLGDFPITLEKNKTRSIWLTVHVPSDQEAGEYQGRLRLRQGKETLASVPYTVTVYPATVPARINLAVTNHFHLGTSRAEQFYGCTPLSDPWWQLVGNVARFLGSYHQTSVGANPVMLARAEVQGGAIRYDFNDFIRFVETFAAAGVDGQIEGGNLLHRERRRDAPVMMTVWAVENGQAVRTDLPASDPRAQRFLDTFLPALYRVLKQQGWTQKYLQGILDEPHQWERPVFVETARKVRRLMPGVRTIEPVGARQDLAFMEKTVDIWVPQLGTFDNKMDVLERHVKNGGELWLYTCLAPRGRYPNRFIDYSLLKVRLLHWVNFKYNFRGFLHWGGDYWGPKPFLDTQPVINEGRTYLPPGDAYITYPDRARLSLLSSIRLEQMREGIEDFGLLDELAKKDPQRARDIAGEAVASFTEYVRDPERFRAIHRKLLEAASGAPAHSQ